MTTPLDDSTIPVSVLATVNAHGVCTVSCTPPELDMPTTPNVTIVFTLTAPAGWALKSPSAAVVTSPGTQFPDASVTASGGMSCTLLDLNTDDSLYNYTVSVVKTATGETVRHDPVIRNGGVILTGNPADAMS